MIETSTTSDDDVLKILESHLDGMEGRPDPLKKKTYKGEKRFKWVPKTKKVEPQGLEEVGDIMDEEVIEDQPIKDDDLIISASEKELKGKLKFGSLEEVKCNTLVLSLIFEAQPNQPSTMEGDVEEEEINKPEIVEDIVQESSVG